MIGKRALLLFSLLLLLLVPGCGGDSSTSAGTQAGGASPPSGVPAPKDGFEIEGEEDPLFGFFREAAPADRRAVSKGLVGYMKAREAGDWKTMCRYIAPREKAVLQIEAKKRPELEGASCEGIVAALSGSAAQRKNTMTGPIDSARWAFSRALALYHGSDGNDYVMPMLIHYGDWEVGALAPEKLE
ncbi:MAG TPA: hypothetical protein VFU11_04625 [Solirubrobacterales bacterium]|nr:hypothetical protein [Solirubrobacterales bacterium]